MPLYTPPNFPFLLLGYATGVNFNSVADTPISIVLPAGARSWRFGAVIITEASGDCSSASFAVYSAAAAGGTAIRAITACNVNTASANTANNLGAFGPSVDAWFNLTTVYFRITTPQGAARTASVYQYGYPMP